MTYKHWLIIVPSNLEADFYFDYLTDSLDLSFSFKCQTGKLGSQRVTIAQTGLGKLNAGLATYQILEAKPQIDLVISTGIGGINPQTAQTGDIILAKTVQDSDFGYLFDHGSRAKLNLIIPNLQITLSTKLNQLVKKGSKTYSFTTLPSELLEYNLKYGHEGQRNCLKHSNCLSGDIFIHGINASAWYKNLKVNYGLLDMESYAVCKVAQIFQRESLIIKGACNFDKPWATSIKDTISQKLGMQNASWVAAETFRFIHSLKLKDC